MTPSVKRASDFYKAGHKTMRIDKYLKVSRLIKRRTVAAEACGSDHVTVNGKAVKPSYDVKVGDVISIRFGANTTSYKVLAVREHSLKADASDMYEQIQ